METVPEGYFCAYENKVLVLDKANEDIILVAKFNSFSSISEDLRNEFSELTKHFIHLKDGASEVKINSAKTHGRMYALGWTCGMDKGKTLGHFAPSPFIQQNISRLEEWEEDQKTRLKWISCFYKKRFNFLAPSLNEVMLKEAKENNILDISDCEFDKLESECPFVNKLIFIVDRFENRIHLDND